MKILIARGFLSADFELLIQLLKIYDTGLNALLHFTLYGQNDFYTKLNDTLFLSKLSDKFTGPFKYPAFCPWGL